MSRPGSFVLLLSVFLIAVSALIYELIAGAVSSYLLGSSVTQFSLVIGIFLSAMGLGSYLSKFIEKDLLLRFIQIEICIGLIGGASALILFSGFTYTDIYLIFMVSVTGSIGTLIGLEIPLLIRILRAREESLSLTVSNVMTFDYIGSLAAALAFPFLLLPHLGLLRSSFMSGLLNIGVAWLATEYFRDELKRVSALRLCSIAGIVVIGIGLIFSTRLVGLLEDRMYPDEVIYAKQTPYQRLVITKWRHDVRLFIDGNLQFSSRDEYRYHESLVHPAMNLSKHRNKILVLGGGDGLAAREILKYPDVRTIDVVDIDPEMTTIFREKEQLAKLNSYALRDARVHIINRDALKFLEDTDQTYDVIIQDLPDPNDFSIGKLYTKSFYTLIGRRIHPHGVLSVQSGSPFFAPDAFWCIHNTIKASTVVHSSTGTFHVKPFHVNVPAFGEWGFVLASPAEINIDNLAIPVETKFLNNQILKSMFVFPGDMQPRQTEINRFDNQILVEYYLRGYREFSQ
jgi:spermidine synthase